MSGILEQWNELLPALISGLWVTLSLTGAVLLVGMPFGLSLASLASARLPLMRWSAMAIIEIGRGAPGLVMLYIVYYGLPQVELTLSSFLSAVAAMSVTAGAYSSEIFRTGLMAVPAGQREASQALGLNAFDEFRLVVLPQAVKVVIPPLIGLAILLFQATSLAYVVAVPELLSRAYNTATITYEFMAPLTLAGLIYAVISLAGVALLRVRRPRRRRVWRSREAASDMKPPDRVTQP